MTPRLLAITNRHLVGGADGLLAEVAKLVGWGVPAILLREKDLAARELADLAVQLLAIVRVHGAQLLIADRVDVALAVGADGAHLATHSLPVGAVRRIVPGGFLLGTSCHNAAELRDAQAGGADYALLSPVFSPSSKAHDGSVLGIEGFQRLRSSVKLPVLALGGISPENAELALRTGAHGLAAIGAFFPARAGDVRRLVTLLTDSRHFPAEG